MAEDIDINWEIASEIFTALGLKLERPDKDLPVIAMTADAFSDDAQHCLECGMNAHLVKPLDIKECLWVLHKYLG